MSLALWPRELRPKGIHLTVLLRREAGLLRSDDRFARAPMTAAILAPPCVTCQPVTLSYVGST